MTDNEKLKALLSKAGLTKPGGSIDYQKVSEITGHSYNSVKSILQPNAKIPRWLKLLIYVGNNKDEKAV